MPFFQNTFMEDFEANWLLGDRHHIPKFVVPYNAGRGNEIVNAWNHGPYDLSGTDSDSNSSATLDIVYALRNPENWATLSVDITSGASSTSAVTTQEIVSALNNNSTFAERFTASTGSFDNGDPRVSIRQKRPKTEFRFHIANGKAEESLRFNARAGVAELPSFFSRHTMANRFTYDDSQNHLIELDPAANKVDAAIINNAVDNKGVSLNYSSSSVSEDWELLQGKSGLFQFINGPSTNATNTTETEIIFSAGARAGDLAKKIITEKDTSGVLVKKYELPYTLTSSDLITPP